MGTDERNGEDMTEDYECPFCGRNFTIGDDSCYLRMVKKSRGEPFKDSCFKCGAVLDLNSL
jgi:hypothetical protein